MAKARAHLHRTAEQLNDDDVKIELKDEDAEEQLVDESHDGLEESARTVDSSDEEIDESVAEDMARFEDSFVGISKRYRLINRIGEGECPQLAELMQGDGWN